MITPTDLKALILATPMLLAGCCDMNRPRVTPPEWMMEAPELTQFIEPLVSLTSDEQPKKTPQN